MLLVNHLLSTPEKEITMKTVVKYLIAVPALISSLMIPTISYSECYENDFLDTFCPYAGLEAKWQNIIGRADWAKIFHSSHLGGSFFFGSRFCQFLGVEIGYTDLFERTRKHLFSPHENFFRNGDTNGAEIRASNRFSSGYVDLNGYYPCFDGCFDFIGTIGVSAMQPRVYVRVPNLGSEEDAGFFADDAVRLEQIRGQTKTIFRLGAGAQYMFCDCVGLRGIVRYENTSALRLSVPARFDAPFNTDALRRPFRDSVSIALGVFAAF